MANQTRQSDLLPTMEQVEEERRRIRYRAAYRRALFETVEVLLLVAATAVLISTLFLPVLQISGNSMEPTLSTTTLLFL